MENSQRSNKSVAINAKGSGENGPSVQSNHPRGCTTSRYWSFIAVELLIKQGYLPTQHNKRQPSIGVAKHSTHS
jgi:hypothetical protein